MKRYSKSIIYTAWVLAGSFLLEILRVVGGFEIESWWEQSTRDEGGSLVLPQAPNMPEIASTTAFLIGASMVLVVWFITEYVRIKRFKGISYTLEQSDNRWHIVIHNESEDATFGAILNFVNFQDWQSAPVGSVRGTWRVNTEATPWKKVMKGERAAMPLCKLGKQLSVFFYENDRFGLCLKNTENLSQSEEILVEFKMQENPNWSRHMRLIFSGGQPVVTSSELPLHQSH